MYWVYSRPLEPTLKWLEEKFKGKTDLIEANQTALKAGYNAGDIRELFQGQYEVPKAAAAAGHLPQHHGQRRPGDRARGGRQACGTIPGVFCSYPITPASGVLEALANYKHHGILTVQSEDEIAAICSAIGASFAGSLGHDGNIRTGHGTEGRGDGPGDLHRAAPRHRRRPARGPVDGHADQGRAV